MNKVGSEKFDAVIIGGGITGTSIAYHLSTVGGQRLLLLERGAIGGGSTSRTAGGLRKLFATNTNIELSRLSQEKWRTFKDDIGWEVGYHEPGYMFLASAKATMSRLSDELELQRSLGVDARLLNPQEVRGIVPQLEVDDLLGGVHCPSDAQLDPMGAVQAYARKAAQNGTEILEWTRVQGVDTSEESVAGVVLDSGESIATDTVVIACGVWGTELLEQFGLSLKTQRYRRELFISDPQDAIVDTPFVSDVDRGWYFLTKGDRLWMSGNREPYENWSQQVYWHTLTETTASGAERLPLIQNLVFAQGSAGLYSQTEDGHAILGWVPGVERLLIVGGDAGHGVMHAPAMGQLASELLMDRPASLPIGDLSPDRLMEPVKAVQGMT